VKTKDAIITKKFSNRIGVALKNIVPGIIFKLTLKHYKKFMED